MARWASLVEQRRRERPVLLIDTGDFYPARPLAGQEVKDRYLFSAMSLLGYDAIGIGEYETRNDAQRIMASVERNHLPFVSSNILDKRSGKRIAEPFRIRTIGERRSFFGKTGGWRVGILSVAQPEIVYRFGDHPAEDYYVVDPRISALEAVKALRAKGCSVVIAISHQGLDASRELARDVPGIDVVISTHFLTGMMTAERVGRTFLVDPGQKETSFTEVEIAFKKPYPEFNASNQCPSLLKNPGDERFLKLEADFVKESRAAKFGPEKSGVAPADTAKRDSATGSPQE